MCIRDRHVAELILAQSVTRLGSDLVRRHRPRVVDGHAFAPEVDVADGRSCEDVALEGREGERHGRAVGQNGERELRMARR